MEMYISKRASKLDFLKTGFIYSLHSPLAYLSWMGGLTGTSITQDVLGCKQHKAELKVALARKWISSHIKNFQHRAGLSIAWSGLPLCISISPSLCPSSHAAIVLRLPSFRTTYQQQQRQHAALYGESLSSNCGIIVLPLSHIGLLVTCLSLDQQ